MLIILLQILKILGIVLLVLLGIILLLLISILFVPIRYKGEGHKNTQDLEAWAQARWMFGLVKVLAEYKGGFLVQAKILAFALYDSGKPPKQQKVRRRKKRSASRTSVSVAEQSTYDMHTQSAAVSFGSDSSQHTTQTGGQTEENTQFSSKIEKLKYTIHNIYDKIKKISENVEFYQTFLDDKETRAFLKHVVLRLGNIFKVIKPGKCKGDVVFGTGSPDTTGYAFGVYGMLSPHLGEDVIVTPDFTEARLEGELELSGHFMLFFVLMEAIKILLDRRLQIFLDKLKEKP